MKEEFQTTSVRNRVTTTLTIVYLVVLFWILILKLGVRFSYMDRRGVNLIPFDKADVGEMMLNVLIFVPLGIYSGILLYEWNFAKKLFFSLLMSLMVEGLQFAMAIGAFDITDLICNTLGGFIGLITFKIIEKAFNNRMKAQRFINVTASIGTLLVILLLLLLKLNMLPIRYQ